MLVPALLTDALDGWIARACGLQSRLGARLDSLGDSLVWWAGLAGLLAFQRDVLAANRWLIGAVVAGWLCENVLAWRRYGRLSSFHTVLSKIAGVLLSVYIGALFLFGHWDALLWLAAVASLLASAEELWLLCPAAGLARGRKRRVVVVAKGRHARAGGAGRSDRPLSLT